MTVPMDPAVYARYIASKSKEEMLKQASKGIPHAGGGQMTSDAVNTLLAQEVETVQQMEEKGWTGR